jgi:stearoyl-CoA desaturase (delta-9 desaturase)
MLPSRAPWARLTGFLWGGAVRLFVVEHTISTINSLTHTLGSQPTRGDKSRDLGVVALLGWGEGSHNNHHTFPYSAAFGLSWYEFDPGFLFIRLLEILGLAWNVKTPAPEKIARRRLGNGTGATGDLEAGQ